jgi:N-acetyl-gamma-glutamylphosphate reductase
MNALIIGATGETGKDLVNVLLQDPVYTSVIAFVRRRKDVSCHIEFSESPGAGKEIPSDANYSTC